MNRSSPDKKKKDVGAAFPKKKCNSKFIKVEDEIPQFLSVEQVQEWRKLTDDTKQLEFIKN
jgi:phage terminase small subunit